MKAALPKAIPEAIPEAIPKGIPLKHSTLSHARLIVRFAKEIRFSLFPRVRVVEETQPTACHNNIEMRVATLTTRKNGKVGRVVSSTITLGKLSKEDVGEVNTFKISHLISFSPLSGVETNSNHPC
jgi:hypothetical protein